MQKRGLETQRTPECKWEEALYLKIIPPVSQVRAKKAIRKACPVEIQPEFTSSLPTAKKPSH